MADYGVYWRNFERDMRERELPIHRWYTNNDRLAKELTHGARLWLFTHGSACGGERPRAAFLMQIFVVDRVLPNANDNSSYPTTDFAFVLHAQEESSAVIVPPLLIDEIIRPAGHGEERHIGTLRQGAWKLDEEVVAGLESLVRTNGHDLSAEPFS